jgi:hypothetical protein
MTTATLDFRLAVRSRTVASDLARLFELDRISARKRGLACSWQRDADGRLACVWEPAFDLVRRHARGASSG